MHVLTPNIYRTVAEALQTFDYITKTGNFGFVDREVARWSGVTIMVRPCNAARACASLTCGVAVHAVENDAEEAAQHRRRARGAICRGARRAAGSLGSVG